jgi:hypothetical protein
MAAASCQHNISTCHVAKPNASVFVLVESISSEMVALVSIPHWPMGLMVFSQFICLMFESRCMAGGWLLHFQAAAPMWQVP